MDFSNFFIKDDDTSTTNYAPPKDNSDYYQEAVTTQHELIEQTIPPTAVSSPPNQETSAPALKIEPELSLIPAQPNPFIFDVQSIKPCIKRLLDLDSQISVLQEELQKRRKEKLLLSNQILQFMDTNEIPCFILKSGKLKTYQAKRTKPITKILIANTLSKFFPSRPDIASQVISHIDSQRPMGTHTRLKRTKNKK